GHSWLSERQTGVAEAGRRNRELDRKAWRAQVQAGVEAISPGAAATPAAGHVTHELEPVVSVRLCACTWPTIAIAASYRAPHRSPRRRWQAGRDCLRGRECAADQTK